MALKDKYQKKLYETGSSGDVTESAFWITGSLEEEASRSFASGYHIQNRFYFKKNKAIIYQLKLIEQDIDELRRFTEQAISKVIDTTTAALRITTGSLDGGSF